MNRGGIRSATPQCSVFGCKAAPRADHELCDGHQETSDIAHRNAMLRDMLGRAELHACAVCRCMAKDWFFDQRRATDGSFSVDPQDFLPVCRNCRRLMENLRRMAPESQRRLLQFAGKP